MDPHMHLAYLNELLLQCEFATQAYEDFCKHRRVHSASFNPATDEAARARGASFLGLHRSAHSLLTHAAVISKILDPSSKGKNVAARKTVAIALSTELGAGRLKDLRNRKLRNGLEHFDEWLYGWTTSAHDDYWSTISLGSSYQSESITRALDPSGESYTFGGKTYSLSDIMTDIAQLRLAVHEARTPLIELLKPEDWDEET